MVLVDVVVVLVVVAAMTMLVVLVVVVVVVVVMAGVMVQRCYRTHTSHDQTLGTTKNVTN